MSEFESLDGIWTILKMKGVVNGMSQVVQVVMEMVGGGQVFQVKPEALNGIEEGTVLGQPDHPEAFLKESKGGSCGIAAVIGSIVHDQNDLLLSGYGLHNVFQKLDEAVTVLAPMSLIQNVACLPVAGAEDVNELRCAGCGNALALPTFHPAAAQKRMETQSRFVHKEEDEGVVVAGLFFSQSSNSVATAFACSSCSSRRSCLGWRWTNPCLLKRTRIRE